MHSTSADRYPPSGRAASARTWAFRSGFSVYEKNGSKIYGNIRDLSIIGREKGLWPLEKAPSRIKKKIGRQALRPENAKFQAGLQWRASI
jgi:hypothetical protein